MFVYVKVDLLYAVVDVARPGPIEVGQGVYSAAGSSIRFIVVNPEFEDDYSFSGVPSWTRPGKPRMSEVYSTASNYRPSPFSED
jgi:hypothetical protein